MPQSSGQEEGSAAQSSGEEKDSVPQTSGQIYLYGEVHGVNKIYEKEFELWAGYYHDQGMRHLFLELPYFSAEYLNQWMQADGDEILDGVYRELEGTLAHNPGTLALYRNIKSQCPDTVFHGTDVGHQYQTTGQRFLSSLEAAGQKDSEQYRLTLEAIEQGKKYYAGSSGDYRENKMAENFLREYGKLNGESIMGIYGAAHIRVNTAGEAATTDTMAKQVQGKYGENLHLESLEDLAATRVDTIELGGKSYKALYFGEEATTWSEEYTRREFWRLENAYEDVKNMPKTGQVLPYNNYPTTVEVGQVFVTDFTKKDGSVERFYFRSDGALWKNQPSTEEFTVE